MSTMQSQLWNRLPTAPCGVGQWGPAPVRAGRKHQQRNNKLHGCVNAPTIQPFSKTSTCRMSVRVNSNDDRNSSSKNGNDTQPGATGSAIPAGLLLFVCSAAFTLTSMRDELSDVLYSGSDGLSDLVIAGFGVGDALGAVLWSAALWYVSPLQLLLVFLGKIDTERPSDWIMDKLGRATQQPVDAVEYAVPTAIKAAAAATCLAGGVTVAAVLGAGLGDPTWAISSGIGALFAAGIFEVGRPAKLSPAEAQRLESQWQDFAAFADACLQRSGRCHESEVFQAFRRRYGKYRSPDTVPDSTLRDMIRNWHPGVERTRTGYLRNIAIKPVGPTGADRAAAAAGQQSQQRLDLQGSEKSLLDSIAEAAAEEEVKQQSK